MTPPGPSRTTPPPDGWRNARRSAPSRGQRTSNPALQISLALLEGEAASREDDHRQRQRRDRELADCADRQRAPALLRQLTKIGAQTDAGKRQQKGPPRQIRKV